MAKLPTVAIIGRPNTGKSTLFNRLTRSRLAIVSDFPGTTRDHVAQRVDTERMSYLLIDTGGIGGGSQDHDLEEDVSKQSLIALSSADLIVLTLNAKEELTAADRAVVELLRKKRKRHVPVLVAATKCDQPTTLSDRLPDYHRLGIADAVVGTCAVHGQGIEELNNALADALQKLHFAAQPPLTPVEGALPRIAVVGRPNVGKSSIINAFMSDPQRALSPRLVSDIPGTTRDASDTIIRHEGRDFIFVDTAGMRRKARVEEDIESISVIKSIQALEDSDIVVLVLAADEEVSKQDKRIASMAVDAGKGLVILVNKSDKLDKDMKIEKTAEVAAELVFCRFAPLLFVSAVSREGLLKIFPLLDTVHRNRTRRIAVKDLRRWYEEALQRVPARKLGQSKHVTQAKDLPPTFVLFMHNPKSVQVAHLRYLENSLRQTFSFEGSPIRWITKEKGRREENFD